MIPRKDSSRHAIYSLLSGRVGFWIDNWEIVPDFPRKPALWAGFLFPRSPNWRLSWSHLWSLPFVIMTMVSRLSIPSPRPTAI